MADETTYDSEMKQPIHRPGMESVVNRGATASSDARDANGNRTGDRPTVGAGHVDPFSIKGDGAPPPAAKPASTPAPSDPSGIGGRQRESTIMGQADKAVTG